MTAALIRPASKDDVPRLSRLAKETFCETFVDGFRLGYPPADLAAFLEASYAPQAVETWIADEAALVLVAEGPHDLIAYAHAGDNTLPVEDPELLDAELKRLYVSRNAQGQRLGSRLFDETLAWLGPRRTFIGVWSGNDKAIALYRSRGFEKVGAYSFMVGQTADDELILRR